ncbi:NfeD family protein [Geoalkalibacter halelectricus]|uniref:NfeD family protein n=1 Tax=Geoalkalibacter halelectricus TaxID=2847045 RepID=UPI003D207730
MSHQQPAPRPTWTPRILLRYALLQIPALALLILGMLLVRHWWDLPAALPWLIVGGWLLKDIVLFPLVWRSYDPDPQPHGNSLLGCEGLVVRALEPAGMVRVHDELWRARLVEGAPILPGGRRVRVCGREGLTLIVEAVEEDPPP